MTLETADIDLDAVIRWQRSRIDHFYRKWLGLASTLLSCDGRVITLEVQTDCRWSLPPEETARRIASEWKKHPSLANLVGYVVHLYRQDARRNYCIPVCGRGHLSEKQEAFEREWFRRGEALQTDTLLAIVPGLFDNPRSLGYD
ncbi:hypothetical protein N9X25_04420 [Verrucomicrobiales bacterium]|nr:hypothetical protein [Verrucomicrobiales bacterium]